MEKKTNFSLSSRLLIIMFLLGVGFVIAAVSSALVIMWQHGLLAGLTLQAVFAFILPAVAAMAIFYRRPFHAMALDCAPSWMSLLVVVLFYIVSLPAMNWLVSANEAMTLPSWMSGIEQWMRIAEDSAADSTRQLLDIHSIGQLLLTIFVVGLMAGVSEEMFFRGALLRTMQDSRMGTHAVVWIVAIIFSAIHLQFYGFIPRMVLGLWLGYLLVWTRCLWVPIIAHTLNNSTVVVFSFLANKGIVPESYGDDLGLPADGGFPWLAILSFAASIALAVWTYYHFCVKERRKEKII